VAHRIVEEFMLAANEAVARWFGARELPTIYRVHGVPDEEKLAAFLDLAAAHGFEVPEDPRDPRALNALLEALQGHPQQRALNQLLLRAMMQAVYSPENIGHYGLAAEHYLHFTSPIRRYPDLVVHRLLKEEWTRRRDGGAGRRTALPALEEKAVVSSERERAAMEAEREIAAFYAALFMKDKIGEAFDGVVSAVVEFGAFVELRPWFVEGLVKAEDLGGAMELDPVQHALVDVTTGRSFRVGDEVRVEVQNVSVQRRRIDLALLAGAAARAPEGAAPAPARAEAEAPPAAAPPARERRALATALEQARRRGGTGRGRKEDAGRVRGRGEGRARDAGTARRSGDGHRERGGMSVELVPGGQSRRAQPAPAPRGGKAAKPGKGAPRGPRARKDGGKGRRRGR
jgi:ribonuclease R